MGDADKSTAAGTSPLWSDALPNWLSRLLNGSMRGLSVVVVIGALFAAGVALPMSNRVPLFTSVALAFPAVVIHEFGHALAARLHGMRVMEMCLGSLHILPLTRGLRWRIASPPKGTLGMVHAVPDPERPLRPAMLWLVMGGPLANLVTAVVCLLPVWLSDERAAGYALAFLLINAGFFLANVLPFTGRHHSSDGWQWLQWRYGWPEGARELALLRLLSLSVAGTTAERIPASLLGQLETLGKGGELLVIWMRLKASQQAGEWSAVEDIERSTARIVDATTTEERAGLKWILALLRLESSFSRALLQRDAAALPILPLDREIRWRAPHMEHRFAALGHGLAGDRRRCEERLARAVAAAQSSQELALHESEAKLAQHVRALLEPHPALPHGSRMMTVEP